MIRPIGKNILVKVKPPEKKPSIILTTAPSNDEPFHATVVGIGTKAELDIQVNDLLLLVPYCGSKISKEDDGLLLISERDIMGVVV
jgi:co-chaperonin GroES (HSP10)